MNAITFAAIRAGVTLRNGALVLAVKFVNTEHGVVLCQTNGRHQLGATTSQPYATWLFDASNGATYSGRYFDSVSAAAADFDART